MSLTADFANKRITGCLGCIEQIGIDPGLHLYPAVPWQGPEPAALSADYDLQFSASFDAKGAFESSEVTVTHPERTITTSAGTWRGQFSNVPDADGNPRRVVGSTDVHLPSATVRAETLRAFSLHLRPHRSHPVTTARSKRTDVRPRAWNSSAHSPGAVFPYSPDEGRCCMGGGWKRPRARQEEFVINMSVPHSNVCPKRSFPTPPQLCEFARIGVRRYLRMVPKLNPVMRCFWMRTPRMTTGMVMTVPIAACGP